jgi:hypothetical protein
MTSFSAGIALKANASIAHRLFSSGASSDELRMGNQRLICAPVEDLRQATTGTVLGSSNHVLFQVINNYGQKQSRLILMKPYSNQSGLVKPGAPGGI